MSSYAALLAVVSALLVASAAAQQFGGATSCNAYVSSLITAYNTAVGGKIPTYLSVGSSAGIGNFTNGNFAVGMSDDPMTAAQDKAAPKKLTLPLTLGTYSFITIKKQGLKISGVQLAKIYLGTIKKWKAVKGGKGVIIPVCRSDGSGTTGLVTKYLAAAYSQWPANFVGNSPLNAPGNPFSPKLTGAAGSSGVATLVTTNKFTIGYVQSGVGVTQYHAYEIGITNPAGSYVFATQADPTQSIPRTLPPYKASWASVTLLNKIGSGTYPIASFVYMFARRTYKPTAFNPVGSTIKGFLIYTQTDAAANAGGSFFFYTIPSSIRQKTTAAIRKIVA